MEYKGKHDAGRKGVSPEGYEGKHVKKREPKWVTWC